MNNLVLCEVMQVEALDLDKSCKHNTCLGYREDSTDLVLLTCSDNLILQCFNEKREQKWCKHLNHLGSKNNSCASICMLSFDGNICLGLGNGEIIIVKDNGNICEQKFFVKGGIAAMEWSPDQERLAIVTKDSQMLLMSCTFDIMNKINLLDDHFGDGEFVKVGWGKKETQFRGQGKRSNKNNENDCILHTKNFKKRVSWRGDGEFYAIGYLKEQFQQFKVFDRDGNLQYTSEKQQGLEDNLSWRPSGNMIATTQVLPGRVVVAFFEKNGLKHGEFRIPEEVDIGDIVWSSDSQILALLCRVSKAIAVKVLVYTTSNHHWYLKQTIYTDYHIEKIFWDNDFDDSNRKLYIVGTLGELSYYTWIWDVTQSAGKNEEDNATVAVIDGPMLLLTAFRQAVVPPPMAAVKLTLNYSIREVVFYRGVKTKKFNSNSFFIITEFNRALFYKLVHKTPLEYHLCADGLAHNNLSMMSEKYSWLWISENRIVSILYEEGAYSIVEHSLCFEGFSVVFEELHRSEQSGTIMRIQLHPDDKTKVLCHMKSGEIVEYTTESRCTKKLRGMPTFCEKFDVFKAGDEVICIGLSHKGNLYFDDELILNNVTSFFIHSHFLLITTSQHLLLCVELNSTGVAALKSYRKTESPYVYKRNIETGAKLVTAVPYGTRTVFEMPRGNLEAIQPRPLSLKVIGEFLDDLNYGKAIDLMRKQRINLNLMYDHDPEKFMNNCDKLVNIDNMWLNLFLADLDSYNVTETMYSSIYANMTPKKNPNKVSEVCSIIREKIKMLPNKDVKALPLLTTYVKSNTMKDLEAALKVVKELKTNESEGVLKVVSSDEAIKHLLYMVDVNRLFEIALGMYDFDLVLLIASKSQKDPKEYLELLNRFNDLEENYKQYSVNKHLKRFDRAVECLAKCGPQCHEEMVAFVKYHSLYKKALEVLKPGEEIYKTIANDYGIHLKLNGQYLEAGIVFGGGNNSEKAIECYKKALEWELAIELGLELPRGEFETLCRDLVEGLQTQERHEEALKILEVYCNNAQDAIMYAIGTSQYKAAQRLISERKRFDLRDNLHQKTKTDYENLQTLIATNEDQFSQQRSRLKVVREQNKANPTDFDNFCNRDSDLYSDAGSTTGSVSSNSSRSSRGSVKSHRSGKSRRKYERKMASLKEGSLYEDIALVIALHTLIANTFQLRMQVRRINVALLGFRMSNEAALLQGNLDKLLNAMKDSFKEIWTNAFALDAVNAAIAVAEIPEYIPRGIALLDPQMRIAPVIPDVKWKLNGLI